MAGPRPVRYPPTRPVTARPPARPGRTRKSRRRNVRTVRRSIAVYDIENLMWPVRYQAGALRRANHSLLSATLPHGVLFGRASAPSRLVGALVGELPPSLQPFPAAGPDAADRVLTEWLNISLECIQSQELLIISGDHAFAEPARRAARMGVQVRVAALRGRLSAELYRAADAVHLFEVDPCGRLQACS